MITFTKLIVVKHFLQFLFQIQHNFQKKMSFIKKERQIIPTQNSKTFFLSEAAFYLVLLAFNQIQQKV